MAAALIGAAVSGGSNILSSLGTAGIQSATSVGLQSSEQSFNQNVMSRAENAFTSVGLPKYMAYGGSDDTHLPGQQFQLRGGNFYSAGLVGQNVPFLSTSYQALTHTGRPNVTNPPNNALGKNNEMGIASSSRPGLGYVNFVKGSDSTMPGTSRQPPRISMINNPVGTYNSDKQLMNHAMAAKYLNNP